VTARTTKAGQVLISALTVQMKFDEIHMSGNATDSRLSDSAMF